MTNHPPYRHSSAFLVDIAGTQALIDAAGERLFVLNGAGADSWCWLRAGNAPRTLPESAFAERLASLGLVHGPMLGADREPVSESTPDEPRILAEAPLQVAAGTSDPNPFSADAIW
jgi:hypothetical protein